jgi:hypothetical protein
MALTFKDTVGEGKRPGAGTLGALAMAFLRMRFETKNRDDLRAKCGWESIFISLSLAAGDEWRMVKAEDGRETKDCGAAWRVKMVADRRATCDAVSAVADVGYYLTRARVLWYCGGNFQAYKECKERGLAALDRVREMFAKLPADTCR